MSATCVCGTPTPDAHLCVGCTKTLEHAITNIAHHWLDLDNVRAKLTRYGGQGGPHGDRLPIDPRFARYAWVEATNLLTGQPELQCWIPDGTALLDAVRNTITTWTRVTLDHWPAVIGPVCETPCLHVSCAIIRRSRPPADTITACCHYLRGWTGRMRVVEWAPEILDEMTHLELQLRALVDRPADRWYAGPCDQCQRDLYARTGAAEVTCRECDLVYDVAARRAWLLSAAEDQLVNATTLARAASWLGDLPLTAARVWKWAERNRIAVKGHEEVGGRMLPTYRVGDALAILAAESAKVG
jgi:hypothetical protein